VFINYALYQYYLNIIYLGSADLTVSWRRSEHAAEVGHQLLHALRLRVQYAVPLQEVVLQLAQGVALIYFV